MGLRCLLGHDFGAREVERERQEDGSEVVVTYRTVETCQRCGERRIVSENKEVRPIRTGGEMETGLSANASNVDVTATADTPADATADAADAVDSDAGESVDSDPSGVKDPADAIDDAEPDPEEPTAEEDDAIILTDDDEDDGERARGQWPDADVPDRGAAEADADDGTAFSGWPEHDGEDEGFDAESSSGGGTEVSFGGGLAPESAATNGEMAFADAAEVETAEATADETEVAGTDKEFIRTDAASVDIERSDPSTETEFYCPNCGLSRRAGTSSMRAGDICPECRRGYVAEREL